ncbi:MAG: hypothetical protein ACRDF8_06410, partial [Chloroflexota bacterium]
VAGRTGHGTATRRRVVASAALLVLAAVLLLSSPRTTVQAALPAAPTPAWTVLNFRACPRGEPLGREAALVISSLGPSAAMGATSTIQVGSASSVVTGYTTESESHTVVWGLSRATGQVSSSDALGREVLARVAASCDWPYPGRSDG